MQQEKRFVVEETQVLLEVQLPPVVAMQRLPIPGDPLQIPMLQQFHQQQAQPIHHQQV